MTDADTTRTQTLTTYVVQFIGNATGRWIDTAEGAFINATDAQRWIDERIPTHTSRILKRTVTDEVVAEREEVA